MSRPVMRDVLAFINGVRDEHGIGSPLSAIPSGKPRSVRACPIARAMEPAMAIVDGWHVWFPKTDTTIDLPDHVQAFVDRFDRLEYPELLEDGR